MLVQDTRMHVYTYKRWSANAPEKFQRECFVRDRRTSVRCSSSWTSLKLFSPDASAAHLVTAGVSDSVLLLTSARLTNYYYYYYYYSQRQLKQAILTSSSVCKCMEIQQCRTVEHQTAVLTLHATARTSRSTHQPVLPAATLNLHHWCQDYKSALEQIWHDAQSPVSTTLADGPS